MTNTKKENRIPTDREIERQSSNFYTKLCRGNWVAKPKMFTVLYVNSESGYIIIRRHQKSPGLIA